MKDVSDKYTTQRTARAHAVVIMTPGMLVRVVRNDLPKKDALCVARWAGIQAAKSTSSLIPACHPVPLDYVGIDFECDEDTGTVTVISTVKAEYKTGVEMEALTAVSVAALTLFDMVKPLSEDITITEIRVIEKTGGISGIDVVPEVQRAATVIVVSDSVAGGTRIDSSGVAAREILEEQGFTTGSPVCVRDDTTAVSAAVTHAAEHVELIVLTGGTGPGPRDITASTIRDVCTKTLPGMGEWARAYGRTRTLRAILSDSCAGIYGTSLVLALPGSTAGVRESLQALRGVLHHTCDMIRGEGHE